MRHFIKGLHTYLLPLAVFVFVAFLLAMAQLMVDTPLLIMERAIRHGGWIEVPVVAFYGAFLAWKMSSPDKSAKWRLISWNVFSAVFFLQLALGLSGLDMFLMTGELHLPIPMMILGGPLYRGELSIMTILFLSTIVLTGPAWCSHLCYFGALDNLIAMRSKPASGPIKHRTLIKFSMLGGIVAIILLLRWLSVPLLTATLTAIGFGMAGLLIMIFISPRQGKMIHCLTWCPIGTIVNYTRLLNPFRMRIDQNSCTLCLGCTRYCRYDALNRSDIESGKPGITCTLCGDCVQGCQEGSIHYKLFKMKSGAARSFYLFFTVSVHSVFLALARI